MNEPTGVTFDPAAAAEAVAAARHARQILAPLPPGIAPRTEAEGAAVQRALAGRKHAIPPAGFKIGATARTMQAYLGLSGPAAGFMPRKGLFDSGSPIPFAPLFRPGVECEIGVRLGRNLPPCTSEQAREAVADVFAAIEVVENRYGDLAALGTPTLIADQVFHAAAVVGDPYPDWRTTDLIGLRGRILVDDVERGSGLGGELLGDPMRALAWLAGSDVAAAFGGLRAGQIIMLGSVTPPIWLDGPAEITVEFAPFPAVHLRLT